MRYFSLFILFFVTAPVWGQNSISVLDFVKIKDNKQAEALFYYENNWKAYRDIALSKGYIKDYRLLKVLSDTTTNFDLMLITEYTDSSQYRQSEERFQTIINASPNGMKLLNDLKPSDFRQNLFFRKTETLFRADEKLKKKQSKRSNKGG